MNFDDDEVIRQQFADWAADALPFHPRSEINHRAWHAWQIATHLERERHRALRQVLERVLLEQRRCPACGHVDRDSAEAALRELHEALAAESPTLSGSH